MVTQIEQNINMDLNVVDAGHGSLPQSEKVIYIKVVMIGHTALVHTPVKTRVGLNSAVSTTHISATINEVGTIKRANNHGKN